MGHVSSSIVLANLPEVPQADAVFADQRRAATGFAVCWLRPARPPAECWRSGLAEGRIKQRPV